MKNIFLCLIPALILGCWSQFAMAQTEYDGLLSERVNYSHVIVEGDVIAERPYQVPNSSVIYTIYTINVYKEFKGQIERQQIEVRTMGGVTEDRFFHASHWPRLQTGKRGVFFFRQHLEPDPTHIALMPSFGSVDYYKFAGRDVANFANQFRVPVEEKLYSYLEELTERPYRKIALTPEEIYHANWQREHGHRTLAASGSDVSIEYTFEDVVLNNLNSQHFLEFDIAAHTNAINSEFGHAEIRLKYDTLTFGSNVVSSGVFTAIKDQMIQSSDYILSTSDIGPDELLLTIDVTANPLNLYDLTQQPEDLVHVMVNVGNVTNWGTVFFQEDSIYTDFYVPFNAVFSEVYDVIAEDTVYAGADASNPTSITYTIENERVTGSSTRFLEFDVYIAAQDTGTYLRQGFVYLEYNTSAFGQSIHTNGKVTLTKGTLMNIPTLASYNFQIQDNLPDRLGINVINSLSGIWGTFFEVPIIKQQLFHIKVEVTDCSFRPEMKFSSAIMAPESFYVEHNDVNNPHQYVPARANDIANPALCAGSGAYISSIHPLQLNGGVGDTLTITGGNFGTNPDVLLRNVNILGNPTQAEYVTVPDYYRLSSLSNDTVIKILFPNGKLSTFTYGWGHVIVEQNGVSDTSFQRVFVNYSVNNEELVTGTSFTRPALANKKLGGYVFHVDSSLNNIPNASDCIDLALDEWRCKTGVNFIRGNDTMVVYTPIQDSALNLIAFVPPNAFSSPKTLGAAYLGGQRLRQCDNTVMYYYDNFDMYFNRNYLSGTRPFTFDPGTMIAIPDSNYDFLGVALHEIGHLHGLGHVDNILAAMHTVSYQGRADKRFLSLFDELGGEFIMETNSRLETVLI